MTQGPSLSGRYLYCLAEGKAPEDFGLIGLEGANVYAITHAGLCAVVHDCRTRPYESQDGPTVNSWVLAHQKVVDTAWSRFGDILPCRFNTIFKGEGSAGPEESLRLWLEKERLQLLDRLTRIKGKAEYGVQVFWNAKSMARQLLQTEPVLEQLNGIIARSPEGTAYLHRQKLDGLLRQALREKAQSCSQEFHSSIRKCVDDIQEEKSKGTFGERRNILNLSCLARREKAMELEGELEGIRRREGFSVRLTGPWPPYSFSRGTT